MTCEQVVYVVGHCAGCGVDINEGDRVQQRPNGQWVHVGC